MSYSLLQSKDKSNQSNLKSKPNHTKITTSKIQHMSTCPCGGECPRCESNHTIQAKLKISQPNDPYEQEANDVSEKIMNMSTSDMISKDEPQMKNCTNCNMKEDASKISRKSASAGGIEVSDDFSSQLIGSSGHPFDPPTRSFMESRFNIDFSDVRIHDDSKSDDLASSVNARAFTVGNDIFLGKEESLSDKKLMSHELVHVIQQRNTTVQRQQIPIELQQSLDVTKLTDVELHNRYDLIVSTLSMFNHSNNETVELEEEAGRIGAELTTHALRAGRTFSPTAVENMRLYFIANAKSASPMSCIATLNKGMRLVINNSAQPVKSEIQTTMKAFQTSGVAGLAKVVEFKDASGKITKGVREPIALEKSVWDTVIKMSQRDFGWSVFGLSIMDGYHSVTLTLDNNDPSTPKVYWSDQWSTKGGWKEYDRTGLDKEITNLTISWWKTKPSNKKPKTRVTLWRITQNPPKKP